jgi:hypothetical protein
MGQPKEENNEQETRRRGDRRRRRYLPEKISLFLLLPQRLRGSCSIFSRCDEPQGLKKDPRETPQSLIFLTPDFNRWRAHSRQPHNAIGLNRIAARESDGVFR